MDAYVSTFLQVVVLFGELLSAAALLAVAVIVAGAFLVSVAIVPCLAPVLSGRHLEVVTARVWAGAALVVAARSR